MSSLAVATIILEDAKGNEQRIAVRDGQELRIGRDEGNEIVIQDPGVSRVHATFSASSTGVVLADLNSLNGVFVNGQRLAGMKDITSNDLVNIGSVKIRVQLSSDEVVDTLSSSSASRAMTAQMRTVSVSVAVFAISDFGLMSEQLPMEDLAEIQLRWMSFVRDSIEKTSGRVDKIIGGSVVAVWMGNEQKQLATQAAEAMQAILYSSADLADGWQHKATHPFSTSCVLSSGIGLKGALGADSSQSDGGFTILGDPVNAAFGLQSLLLETQTPVPVLVDSTSAGYITSFVPLAPLGRKQLPGSDEFIEIYTVN